MSRDNLLIKGKSSGFNYQMCVLSAIAICLVIWGHIYKDEYAIGTLYNWFPYYSFHLPIFIFISGYFFKDPIAKNPYQRHGNLKALGFFFLKKINSLLIPYFVINGLFLLLNTFLQTQNFTYVTTFSLQEWLVMPWIKCYLVTYSLPTWYLLGIFYALFFFVFIRKFFGLLIKNELTKEIVLLALMLAVGVFCAEYCRTVIPVDYIRNFCRAGCMLFYLQLGVTYRKYFEKIDKLPAVWYFAILLAAQFAVLIISGSATISPNLYNMTNFGAFGYDFYITGTIGVMVCLRIARIIAQLPRRNKLLIFIGNNTKHIMTFHVFGFFILNVIFRQMKLHGMKFSMISDFNNASWHKYYYYYVSDVRMLVIYFLFGLFFSLLIAKLIELGKIGIRTLYTNHKVKMKSLLKRP